MGYTYNVYGNDMYIATVSQNNFSEFIDLLELTNKTIFGNVN